MLYFFLRALALTGECYISSSDEPVLMGTARGPLNVKSDLVRDTFSTSLRIAD
jgi:hypothetical protein